MTDRPPPAIVPTDRRWPGKCASRLVQANAFSLSEIKKCFVAEPLFLGQTRLQWTLTKKTEE
jgi:hypothetical protein